MLLRQRGKKGHTRISRQHFKFVDMQIGPFVMSTKILQYQTETKGKEVQKLMQFHLWQGCLTNSEGSSPNILVYFKPNITLRQKVVHPRDEPVEDEPGKTPK